MEDKKIKEEKPKVDQKVIEAVRAVKEKQVATNQIITK